MVVDDQPDIRDLLVAVLSAKGFQVDEARSGREAIDSMVDASLPDLVLLDVGMPEMDGWATLDEIKLRFGETAPRIVMCTVKGHPRDLLRGWSMGCDGYVWKPFDMRLLEQEVRNVIDRPETDRAPTRAAEISRIEALVDSLGHNPRSKDT